MLVVSGTSPILNLALTRRLSLLESQFTELMVPEAVVGELRLNEEIPGNDLIRNALDRGFLRPRSLKNRQSYGVLRRDLDHGEAEAIALALELEAELVLLDERDARRAAKASGLSVTGVLGVLIKAFRMGELDSLETALLDLRDVAGFYLSESIVAEILSSDSE